MSCHIKIVQAFRETHTKSAHVIKGCQFFWTVCPVCDIIFHEQTDLYASAIDKLVGSVIEEYWNRWERNGYRIAHTAAADTLVGSLSYDIFARWIQPRYREINIEDKDLFHHRYVSQKLTRS